MSKFIIRSNRYFPYLLREAGKDVSGIYCLGNVELLKTNRVVAVVGSRQMSEYGKNVTKALVKKLVSADIVIVSGLAFGVDAEAHRICLDNGGKAIAVLASGVDVVSPMGNRKIYEEILGNGGLVVSEYVDGTRPDRGKFLERNRIVAGLSKGVVVVEGGRRSGTLVTARLAGEYGREVWAVPGRIDEENSFAPNYLIKNGAEVILSLEDFSDSLTAVLR